MLSWILSHVGWVITIFIVINIVRMIRRVAGSLKAATKSLTDKNPRRIGNFDPNEADRARRIREEILRKIAQRQSGAPVPAPPPLHREVLRPTPAASVNGPLERVTGDLTRRIREQWERGSARPDSFGGQLAQPVARPSQTRPDEPVFGFPLQPTPESVDTAPPSLPAAARPFTRRATIARPRNPALVGATSETQATRSNLLNDLSDARSLRRAFVLREVLGTPVGLR